MLHRLALRVLPSLSLAVTEESVRKRKRLVMFVPGLAAFGLYRAAKHVVNLADPLTLLVFSGLIALVTAACAYRVGRRATFAKVLTDDGFDQAGWLCGWIGFVYGVQLSLLVLALLWLVGYDYGKHPDGPAMMAIIISCTAVARDAFEIGHVRWLQASGRPLVTFPDGTALRALLQQPPALLWLWVGVGVVGSFSGSLLLSLVLRGEAAVYGQVAVATLVPGSVALLAFFAGQNGQSDWKAAFSRIAWGELVKFWWWPGLAFASTYYLVMVGGLLYLLDQAAPSILASAMIAGAVGGLMTLYCYYLGHRREVENREQSTISSALLRCPFVMGILGQSRGLGDGARLTGATALEKSGQRI